MKKIYKNRLLSVLLSFVLLLSGCSLPSKNSEQHNSNTITNEAPAKARDENIQASFDVLLDNLFKEEVITDTLTLHYTLADPASFGISSYPITLGDSNRETFNNAMEEIRELLESLKSFSYDSLTEKQQLTYDVLTDYLENQLALSDYYLYYEDLSPLLGIQAQLPVLLAEYPFYTETDITDYLMLLEQIPKYFEQILAFEKEKAEAGLFMSDTILSDTISQCRDFIKEPEENYLIASFEHRLASYEGLTEETKNTYLEQNKSSILNVVIPTYENLIQELENLKGSGKNEGGLCNFEKGKEYYTALLKANTGSSRSPEEIMELLNKQLESDYSAMEDLLKKKPSLASEIATYKFPLSDPAEILEDLKEKIKEDFPTPPEAKYEIKYVDSSMEEHLSPAFYLTPTLDRPQENVIYINNYFQYNKLSLYTTLAHEGYPGHLYESVFAASNDMPAIRYLLNYSGYSEGWATYVEMYSYGLADMDKDISTLLQKNSSVTLCLYSILDIGIHYEGWDMKTVKAFLQPYGITSDSAVKSVYQAVVQDPVNYLKYYLGYLEFVDLKEQTQTRLGDKFVLKDFHRAILDIGPASYSVVKKHLEKTLIS